MKWLSCKEETEQMGQMLMIPLLRLLIMNLRHWLNVFSNHSKLQRCG